MVMNMRLRWILVALVLFIWTSAFAQEEKKPDPKFFIYLCFGQSNMEAGSRPEAQDQGTLDPRFQMLAAVDNPRMNRKMGQWYTANPPINRPENNMGPVDWFGRNMVASLPKEYRVGAINVSVAGAGIELWDRDNWQKYLDTREQWMKNIVNQYNGSPYKRLADMGRIAQKDGVIKGMLLHQGESNPNDQQWCAKVKKIHDDLCADLGLEPEDIPLLAGELKYKEEGGVCEGFNTAVLANLPKTMANGYIISAKGVKGTPDQFHFSTAGMRELGKRFAQQMLKLQSFEFKEVERPGLLPAPSTQPATDAAVPAVN
jgi:hypothetical protein